MSARKGLTWSEKWHVIDETKSDPHYEIALCGAELYTPEKTAEQRHRMPEHLQEIMVGTRKSSGDCKRCARKTVSS
jgi:hypothetical protein